MLRAVLMRVCVCVLIGCCCVCSIEHEAARTGICKIVPPRGWDPTFAINLEEEHVQFDTRKQKIHELQVGKWHLSCARDDS